MPQLKYPLDPWRKGDALAAAHLQQGVDALRGLEEYTGFAGHRPGVLPAEAFPAVITDKGPNGETAPTGNTTSNAGYWIIKQYIKGADPNGQVVFADDVPPSGDKTQYILWASNISEITQNTTNTHTLAKGTNVWVVAYFDGGDTNQKHYLFTIGSSAPPLLQVTGTSYTSPKTHVTTTLDIGKYVGNIFVQSTTDDTIGSKLALSDIGTAGSTTVMIYNLSEIGDTVRHIDTSSPTTNMPPLYPGVFFRNRTDDSTPIYLIVDTGWGTCSG